MLDFLKRNSAVVQSHPTSGVNITNSQIIRKKSYNRLVCLRTCYLSSLLLPSCYKFHNYLAIWYLIYFSMLIGDEKSKCLTNHWSNLGYKIQNFSMLKNGINKPIITITITITSFPPKKCKGVCWFITWKNCHEWKIYTTSIGNCN